MYSLVLDPSSLIPCGEKSEEDKKAIWELGHFLYNVRRATIYLSSDLIKIYKTKVAPLLEKHHPLPPFQASLLNLLPQLMTKITKSRGCLCKTISLGVCVFHILETSRVKQYDVDNIGLTEEDDKEVLRIALASAHQETFLVTTDRHFFNINWAKLQKRHPNEAKKVKIVKPNDQYLICYFLVDLL
ncbi:MAG: hypothetical protein QXT98_07410 [Archaeoglobaceae archaeon]